MSTALSPILHAADELADMAVLERMHPLVKLIKNDRLALLYLHTTHNYSVFLRARDAVSRLRALEGLGLVSEEVSTSKALTSAERKVAMRRVNGMLRVAEDGPEAEEIRAGATMSKQAQRRPCSPIVAASGGRSTG